MTQAALHELDDNSLEEIILYVFLMIFSISSSVLVLLVIWLDFGNGNDDPDQTNEREADDVETDTSRQEKHETGETNNDENNPPVAEQRDEDIKNLERKNAIRREKVAKDDSKKVATPQESHNGASSVVTDKTQEKSNDVPQPIALNQDGSKPNESISGGSDGQGNDGTEILVPKPVDKTGNRSTGGTGNSSTDVETNKESPDEQPDTSTENSQFQQPASTEKQIEKSVEEVRNAKTIVEMFKILKEWLDKETETQKGFWFYGMSDVCKDFVNQYKNKDDQKKAMSICWSIHLLNCDELEGKREEFITIELGNGTVAYNLPTQEDVTTKMKSLCDEIKGRFGSNDFFNKLLDKKLDDLGNEERFNVTVLFGIKQYFSHALTDRKEGVKEDAGRRDILKGVVEAGKGQIPPASLDESSTDGEPGNFMKLLRQIIKGVNAAPSSISAALRSKSSELLASGSSI